MLQRFGDNAEFLRAFYDFVSLEERTLDEAEMPEAAFQEKWVQQLYSGEVKG